MKKVRWMVAGMIVMVMLMAGCGSEFAAGTATGAAATGVLEGVATAYQKQAEEIQVQLNAAMQRLTAAASETEKLAAEAEIANLKKEMEQAKTGKLVADTGKTAVSTDWSDPDAVANLLLPVGVAAAGYFIGKKKT